MGAIADNRLADSFPTLVDDVDGLNQRRWRRTIQAMIELGNPMPGVPAPSAFPIPDLSVIDLAAARLHIRTAIGAAIANEIATDPLSIGYASAGSDAAIADAMMARQIDDLGFQPLSVLLRRSAVVGNVATCVAENGVPLTLSAFLRQRGLRIQFFELTPTVSLRGSIVQATRTGGLNNVTDTTIELDSIPGAMTDSDLFRVVGRMGTVTPPRIQAVLRAIPHAPNDVTAQDVTDAQV